MKKQKKENKIVLSFLSQQYGLTVEDVMRQCNCRKDQVIVEPDPDLIFRNKFTGKQKVNNDT